MTPLSIRNYVFKGANASSATTSALTTTSGNLLVVCVGTFTNTIGTVTDSKSNTWSTALASTGGTEGWGAIFYAENCTGGSGHTFTFTPTASDFISMEVFEVGGVVTSGAFNASNSGIVISDTHNTGNVTAGSKPEVAIAFYVISRTIEGDGFQQPYFMGADFVNATLAIEGMASAVRFLEPGETASCTFSMVNSGRGCCGIASFIGAAGSSTGKPWLYYAQQRNQGAA